MLFYYALATITAYILLWIGYQVFLHPLSKYPGPFLAKLSNVYNGYYAWKRCLHLTTLKNQQKYGSVIRQGPNKLIFNSVEALRDIYKTDRTTKTKDYMALGPNLSIHTIFTVVDKTAHRHRRRLIGSVLSDRSMRTFEPTINTQANIFLQTLSSKSKQSQPVNMSQETRRYGMNIAALLAFGYDLRLQTDEENLFLLTVLDVGTFANSFLLQFPFLREWGLGVLLMLPAFRVVEKYFVLVERLITARTALAKDAKHDLYSFVADSLGVEGEEGIRKSELWAEANIFLAAAGDTTRTALSATFFYLSRNPSSYQRLAAEIRSTFTSGDEICGAKLGSCVYLRACIDEALRLASPVSGILWRDFSPSTTPFTIEGHPIPPTTILGINTYSLHHNPLYFPSPYTYQPTRWLPSDKENPLSSTPHPLPLSPESTRDAFAALSLGPRGCAGKAMAYLTISLVLAKTIWEFDFETAEGEVGKIGGGRRGLGEGREREGEFQIYDVFGASHEGPYLEFRRRVVLPGDI